MLISSFIVATFLAAVPASAAASAEVTDIEELSLEALLNPSIEVVTKTSLRASETPAIVTVLSRDDIVHSGARYLMDLLLLVPGFSFGVDVQGTVGIGFRGVWGHEGKVLVLIDGLEMNEILYGTNSFGNHFPLDMVESVEILRGPGSAVYGGFAELAVINLVTRKGKDLQGVSATGFYGQTQRGSGRGTAAVSGGYADKDNDLDFSAHAFFGRGSRSDGTYADFYGNSFDMRGNSALNAAVANVGLRYKGLQMRVLFDDHRVSSHDGTAEALDASYEQVFRTVLAEVRYDIKVSKTVQILPRLVYKYQLPWMTVNKASSVYYDKSAQRLFGDLAVSWDILESLNLRVGTQGFWDHAQLNSTDLVGYQTDFAGNNSVDYGDIAAYAQLVFLNPIVNVTAGARYEYHSAFQSSFVPRIALTKSIERASFKLLFSQAFRNPAIENLNLNPDIRPERTNVLEGEIGVKLTPQMQVLVNGFWGRIERPIVYDVDPSTGDEMYLNAPGTGTVGGEVELQLQYRWLRMRLGYSFYAAIDNAVDLYAVEDQPLLLRGMPAHKVTLNASVPVWRYADQRERLVIGASGTFMSQRFGDVSGDGEGNGVGGALPPQVLANFNVFYHDLITRGLALGVGVNNVTGQTYRLLQPYAAGHAPLPMQSRELWVQLSYAFEK